MNKHALTIYIYLCVYWLATCAGLPAHAGSEKVLRPVIKAATGNALSPQLERKLAGLTYAPHLSAPNSFIQNPHPNFQPAAASTVATAAPTIPVLEDEGVSIADGKGKETGKHSIVPSAMTVLGSPAIVRSEERSIMYLRQQAQIASTAEYIPPLERKRWKEEFEALRVLWIKAQQPSDINDLPRYLTHEVPPDTLAYLQRQYMELVQFINQSQPIIMPRVIYSYLLNEGRQADLEETVYVNKVIYQVRFTISVLLKAINKDPYLLVQQKFWDRMFGAFNPLVKGALAKPTSIFRQDNRTFVMAEFALHNPDGTSPYLPNSKTMIAGEDEEDDFDDEQYAGTPQDYKRRAAQMTQEKQHKAAMMQLAEQERDELLKNIPENLRIAVINDDRLPLINFEYWAKNGYLGKGATVATFRDGFSFLQEIRNGTRYDIVITDLVVPDGGVAMMENFRILDSNAAVLASSKFYPGDGDDHSSQDLFNFGMDGYIWNNSNLNEGSFGYLQYLRQLNNYYYYKNKYGWQR